MLYFLVLVVLGYFLLKESWTRWKYDLHKIPAPPKLPFVGHLLQIKKGTHIRAMNVWLQEWRAKLDFPELMSFCIMGHTSVVVFDINLVRNVVLSRTNPNPRRAPAFRFLHRMVMGNDPTIPMFTSPTTTPYVKAIRRCYSASFTSVGLKRMFKRQMEVAQKGKLYIEEKRLEGTIDFQDFLTRLMLDSAGKAELDVDLGGLDNSYPLCKLLIECGHHIRTLTSTPFLTLREKYFPNSELIQKTNRDFADLMDQWTRITNEVIERGEPDDEDLSVAANIRRFRFPDTNEPLPYNLLRGELASAIIGGFDSTGHQLAWIFALLATNPSVVDKLLDELRVHGLYGKDARELEFEDLSDLEYVTAVIKEAFRRLHTLLFVTARSANRDLELGGYRIPKGTIMLVSGNLSVNCEQEWEDHLAFMPERWLENKSSLADKYYIPFGFGDRDCIGQKFAIQSMKISIIYFLTHYSFELVGDTIETLVQNGVPGIVFEAKNGINMKVTPRTNK
eukprot:g326.t1